MASGLASCSRGHRDAVRLMMQRKEFLGAYQGYLSDYVLSAP